MDVQYRYVYPEPIEENTAEKDRIQAIKIDRLNDSLSDLRITYQIGINEKKSAIATEKNLLINHPLVQGKGNPDSLDLLIGTMEYMEIEAQRPWRNVCYVINMEGAPNF